MKRYVYFLMLCVCLCGVVFSASSDKHQVLAPERSKHLVESAHFVARWNDQDGVQLTDDEIQTGLSTLESIRDFYLTKVGFPAPYEKDAVKYKTDVNLSNKGWATGAGTGKNHPEMWLHFNAFKDRHALSHEFAHCLQFSTMGMRDSTYVGWFWECHAEWMSHQYDPQQIGSSFQLVNAPHLYYGSTRDRYGCWQFWEYIKDNFGYAAINDLWKNAKKQGERDYLSEDPFVILSRNQKWKAEQLNDQFGLWAMRNVTWDYKNGEVYRKHYGNYETPTRLEQHRITLLKPLDLTKRQFVVPSYRAPQRFGYNLVPIDLDSSALQKTVSVRFRGITQKDSLVRKFKNEYEKEPTEISKPESDWRWGLVAVDSKGTPRYSELQRGASGELNFPLKANEKQVWLVVTATPAKHQQIFWDQIYYSIYRYPWMVEIKGGYPRGSTPGAMISNKGRRGSRHANGGGWVESSAEVASSAFVAPEALVLDHAVVSDQARIEGKAIVSGNAKVSGKAIVRDYAKVMENGVVSGNAIIADEAVIFEGQVSEDARVSALTTVEAANTKIHGKAEVATVMNLIREVDLSGTVKLLGDIEMYPNTLTKGVFYGMVDQEMSRSPRWGADRTEAEPEVTGKNQ